MPKVRLEDVEGELYGPDERECFMHNLQFKYCNRCNKPFCPSCVGFTGTNDKGLCDDCGTDDYHDALFRESWLDDQLEDRLDESHLDELSEGGEYW